MEQVRIKIVKQTGGTVTSGKIDEDVAEKMIILLKENYPNDTHSIVPL